VTPSGNSIGLFPILDILFDTYIRIDPNYTNKIFNSEFIRIIDALIYWNHGYQI